MNNKDNAIEVNNVKKNFKVYFDKSNQLKDSLIFWKRNRYEKREVLKGVSFEVKKGEAVGLIGHNGCGKSTTLKLLTRIIYPDSGTIEMVGRVSSLIELGAGFHPDMSGRENIYTNAAIFGLSKKEIEARVNDIIEFSEIEEFIDNPVRTYSSGMYMRLAFSVAINVNADILLIDEILAVGDANFQAKCFNKLREIKAAGTTIVLVSHSLTQIEQLCDTSIWIQDGQVEKIGNPREVHPLYMDFMSQLNKENKIKKSANSASIGIAKPVDRWGSGEVIIDRVEILDSELKERNCFNNNEKIRIRMHYKAAKECKDVVFGIAVYKSDNTYIYGTNTLIDHVDSHTLIGTGYIDFTTERLNVSEGLYSVDLALHKPDGFEFDFWKEACRLDILNSKKEVGIISLEHEWSVQRN